jgi:hypothetical protein
MTWSEIIAVVLLGVLAGAIIFLIAGGLGSVFVM